MPRLPGNRLKIACESREEAKKIGDWKGVLQTKIYTQMPLTDRIATKIVTVTDG